MLARTRLHCSVGIGDNKLRAKIATDFGKPRGTWQLTGDNWYDVMGQRPTDALWGIGSKTSKKLAALGIDTVEQLAHSDARMLAERLGPTMGPWFHRLGRGADPSPVDATPWVPRAHGREETFQEDLTDWSDVEQAVRTLTTRVVEDIDREGRPAARVGIKVRYRPFFTVSRSLTLPAPSNDPGVLADAAVSLLDRVERDRPVRLLGVRLEMTATVSRAVSGVTRAAPARPSRRRRPGHLRSPGRPPAAAGTTHPAAGCPRPTGAPSRSRAAARWA